jgi:uncharacterized membrane protein YhhN
MSNLLLLIAIIAAMLDWLAVAKNWKQLEYMMKPAVIIALLSWFALNAGFSVQMIWFGIGLVFSLAGDIFLMLPTNHFIEGLISFLFAHIAYIIGLNQTIPPLNIVSLILTILVLVTAYQMYRRITSTLSEAGGKSLKIPLLIYTVAISIMLLSALLTLVRPSWDALPALIISIGALMFFISDSILAWNKFVHVINYGNLAVMVTYHLGQLGIILGAAIYYSI